MNTKLENIPDIIGAMNKISNLNLDSSDYDAVFCKKIRSSELIGPGRKSHQAHIAVTAKGMDVFPAIWIDSYQEGEDGSSMKSFFYLKAPVTLYEKNILYSQTDRLTTEDFNNSSTLSTYMSVKLSRRNDGTRQIELGHTSQSDILFKKFREIFDEDDILIIAKKKQAISYDAFIIRKADGTDFNAGAYFIAKAKATAVSAQFYKSSTDNTDLIMGKNIIYYGAPGTGKSHKAKEFAKKYSNKDESNIFRTTLHPEYTYSDFVGQLVPAKDKDKGITYDFRSGIFTQALKYAVENKDENVFLILEEMSRANVAAVFGDIFQLLDRENGVSEYPIKSDDITGAIYDNQSNENDNVNAVSEDKAKYDVVIPRNMTILGTVNTSDQNVFVMDTAFKRRFNWKYVPVDEAANSEAFREHNNPIIFRNITWEALYKALNDFIVNDLKLTEDKQIGPFFIKFEDADGDEAYNLVKDKLLQYLWEDICSSAYIGDNKEKLFKNDISSFSTLYARFSNKDEVFSNAFYDKLNAKQKQLEQKEKDESNS